MQFHPGTVHEPELFQNLKLELNGATVLVFPSGKVLVTGVTTIKDAESAFNALADIILNRDSDHSLGMPQPDWYCQHPNSENPLAVLEKLDDKRKPTAEATSQRKKRNIKAPPPSSQTDRWSVDKWIDLFKADLVQQIQEAEETQETLTAAVKKVRTLDNRVNRAAVLPDLVQLQPLFKEGKETADTNKKAQPDAMVVDDCDIYPFDLGPLTSSEGLAVVVPITKDPSPTPKPTVSVAVQTEPTTNDQMPPAGGPVVVVEEQSQPTAGIGSFCRPVAGPSYDRGSPQSSVPEHISSVQGLQGPCDGRWQFVGREQLGGNRQRLIPTQRGSVCRLPQSQQRLERLGVHLVGSSALPLLL